MDNTYGRIPPQATDIEEILLGTIMLHSQENISAIKELTPEAFYKQSHQKVFAAIQWLFKNDRQIDPILVTKKLIHSKDLELIGGAYTISKLTQTTTHKLDEYVKIIKEKYIKRIYIERSNEIQKLSYQDDVDVFDLQQIANSTYENINELIASGGNLKHISETIKEADKEFMQRIKRNSTGEVLGIDTGITKLNEMLCGWQNSDLVILAARPGMGKTAMALHFAKKAAKQGKSVCIYSLEMSGIRLVDRMIISIADIDADNYRKGNISELDYKNYNEAKDYLETLPIYIDDNPIVTMDYIRANSMVMKRQNKCDMILIDYLQLADMEKSQSREQEVSKASRKAKIIAKSLDVPVILLSQLSRAVETRGGNKKPNLSDLRDSGAIEQDADMVLFLYRPEYYGFVEDENKASTRGYGEIIVSKHRNGALGDVPFKYNPSLTIIEDYNTMDEYMAQEKAKF